MHRDTHTHHKVLRWAHICAHQLNIHYPQAVCDVRSKHVRKQAHRHYYTHKPIQTDIIKETHLDRIARTNTYKHTQTHIHA